MADCVFCLLPFPSPLSCTEQDRLAHFHQLKQQGIHFTAHLYGRRDARNPTMYASFVRLLGLDQYKSLFTPSPSDPLLTSAPARAPASGTTLTSPSTQNPLPAAALAPATATAAPDLRSLSDPAVVSGSSKASTSDAGEKAGLPCACTAAQSPAERDRCLLPTLSPTGWNAHLPSVRAEADYRRLARKAQQVQEARSERRMAQRRGVGSADGVGRIEFTSARRRRYEEPEPVSVSPPPVRGGGGDVPDAKTKHQKEDTRLPSQLYACPPARARQPPGSSTSRSRAREQGTRSHPYHPTRSGANSTLDVGARTRNAHRPQ